jgi:hypothetical protein
MPPSDTHPLVGRRATLKSPAPGPWQRLLPLCATVYQAEQVGPLAKLWLRYEDGTEIIVTQKQVELAKPPAPEAARASRPRKKKEAPWRLAAPPGPSEKQRQQNIVDALAWCGYEVKRLGQIIKLQKCGGCGHEFWPEGGYGNDPGVADLLVTHPDWPSLVWVMLECKTPTTRVRDEQRRLARTSRSTMVRNEWQAAEAIQAVEEEMGRPPTPKLLEWMRVNQKAGGWR